MKKAIAAIRAWSLRWRDYCERQMPGRRMTEAKLLQALADLTQSTDKYIRGTATTVEAIDKQRAEIKQALMRIKRHAEVLAQQRGETLEEPPEIEATTKIEVLEIREWHKKQRGVTYSLERAGQMFPVMMGYIFTLLTALDSMKQRVANVINTFDHTNSEKMVRQIREAISDE